jgi:hypothetical protein
MPLRFRCTLPAALAAALLGCGDETHIDPLEGADTGSGIVPTWYDTLVAVPKNP